MSIRRAVAAAAALLTITAWPATAQRATVQQDSAQAELRAVLRSFYYNLAHHDWEAIAADVLSAKVVASRSVPAALLAPTVRTRLELSPVRTDAVACTSITSADVDRAKVTRAGDWAGVSVPRCGPASGGADEFRLIQFEGRWRFVYIDLFEGPTIVSTE